METDGNNIGTIVISVSTTTSSNILGLDTINSNNV